MVGQVGQANAVHCSVEVARNSWESFRGMIADGRK